MAFKESYIFLCIVFLLALVLEATLDSDYLIDSIHRRNFPHDFVFGSASSAYQYEGAAFIDGKGPSIWDNFTHQYPEKIVDRSTGDVAIDSYHRYKEDVLTLKDIGFGAYRFSISWSRILPKGRRSGGVNLQGIEYYRKLIKELQAKGIEPYITLFHWDVPQALEDEYLGFLNSSIVKDFQDYADLCFEKFGDIVKHWITLNEPWSFCYAGYSRGFIAPGRCSDWRHLNCKGGDSGTEPYIVAHNQILAHAAAVETYRTKYQAFQKGVIGITLVSFWYVPFSTSEADKMATSRLIDFNLGWFLDPLTYGDYPAIMRKLVKERLPHFTNEQTLSIRRSFDFLGMNYYTTKYASDDPTSHLKPAYDTDYQANYSLYNAEKVPIGPMVNGSSWLASYPEGFKALLIHIKEKYNNPIIFVTENGYYDYDDFPFQEKIEDFGRVQYFHDHLLYLNKAIEAGVRVKGYFAWSLMDNFEWHNGYTVRFGITYIDYEKNLTRIPKLSAKWFTRFLRDENYDMTSLYNVNPSPISIADY